MILGDIIIHKCPPEACPVSVGGNGLNRVGKTQVRIKALLYATSFHPSQEFTPFTFRPLAFTSLSTPIPDRIFCEVALLEEFFVVVQRYLIERRD